MKMVDTVDLTKKAVAQTMGAEYMEQNGDFASLESQKIADVGKDVTADTVVDSLATGVLALIGKHVIENRLYKTKLPDLYVDTFDWGGFLERTRVGLSDIMADPMFIPVKGRDYSSIENTYYGADITSKIYGEAKAIMTPISFSREQYREAFTSWDGINRLYSAIEQKVKSTINLALSVYEKMLLSCAVATSDKKNNSAVHLISEATTIGIIPQTSEGENYTYDNIISLPAETLKRFLAFCSKRIAETRQYMLEPSEQFNDKTMPTWCDDEPRLALLNDFEKMLKFNLKADTFHKDELGFGTYSKINSWQAIKASTSTAFDRETVSSIDIASDPTDKLGIGTDGYKASGVVGLMWDYMAIGISLARNKVTSNYIASIDTSNQFHHQLVNYLLDSSYGIVAFIMD